MDFDTLLYYLYMDETETEATNENRRTENNLLDERAEATTKEKELEQ